MGDRRLDTEDLQTGLGVTLKRLDTGSAWVLVNNPRSACWETPADRSYIGNRYYRLAQIVRASTAAPHYFDPQEIEIADGVQGLFVDGGLTPHNNPALALFLAAFVPRLGVGWDVGPDKLTIVSVGAGTFRDRFEASTLTRAASVRLALRAMIQQIGDSQQLILTLMSLLSESPTPWPINAELGDLGSIVAPRGALFRFLRYDIKLEGEWLSERVGATVTADVRLRIAPGFHVNSHEPLQDYLVPTTVSLRDGDGFRIGPVEYPPGKPAAGGAAPEAVSVYENETVLRVPILVPRACAASDKSLVLEISLQVCDDRECFAPQALEAPITVRVREA